jgi:prolipoprotein diacylglyceryltransferase
MPAGGFVLTTWPHAYDTFIAVVFVVAYVVRRLEARRRRWPLEPQYRSLASAALVGAVMGSKLGMLLFFEPDAWWMSLRAASQWELSGKTVVGGLG